MAETNSLQTRARDTSRQVLREIAEKGGYVSGSIANLKRDLGIGGAVNETRKALDVLVKEGLLTGTPLESTSVGMVPKQYGYKLTPKGVIALLVEEGRTKSGTAADFLGSLNLAKRMKAGVLDETIKNMKMSHELAAPIALLANDDDRPLDTYLFLAECA